MELITEVTVTPPVPPPLLPLFTIREIVAVADRLPLVPLIVTMEVPVAAAGVAVKVTVLLPVVDVGLKVAVTPDGRPLAVSETLPENPLLGVTVTTLEAVWLWVTVTLAGAAVRVKLGVPLPPPGSAACSAKYAGLAT